MAIYLKDLIHIPEKIHKGDFVLSLAEGIQKPQETLDNYVVTPQLQHCFRDALEFVRSALTANSSKITYLHGSFGSGKSHFMAVLDLILANHQAVRAKKSLQDLCAENAWTEKTNLLMVPYHMIGAASMEQAILGGYARFVKKRHPESDPPSVYLAKGLFLDADGFRESMGDQAFFEMLNGGKDQEEDDGWGGYGGGWDAPSYEAASKAEPGADNWTELVTTLLAGPFKNYQHVTSGAAEAYLPLDQGLSIVSKHAKGLGYDGIILFLDELVLWLASRAADVGFVHQEGQKLAKLVEAQESERPIPIISFVARQRTLQELVGENVSGMEKAHYDDALRHWSGRFHTIELEDINLPDIVEGRVLRPKDQSAVELIDEAFQKTATMRDDVMAILMTSHGNRDMFRKVYPFSPALVETLVAASSLLQRNRTAIKALMELLVKQREELTLGKVIPVGDLFDIVSQGNEVFTAGMREHFDNAKRLYSDRFRPVLEAEHHITEEEALKLTGNEDAETVKKATRYRNDARLVKTLLLSALVPRVESLQALTPARLAALNYGTINVPLPGREASTVLAKLRKWNTQIGELRIPEGDNPTITLQLVGVDVERILEYSRHLDIPGNRKKKIKELLAEATGVQTQELVNMHTVLWRGTEHSFPVEFANVREKTTDSLKNSGDGWRLLIDFPFDEGDFGPRDDLGRLDEFRKQGEASRTLVWLPQFLTSKVKKDLARLIMFDHVLSGDNFKEATRHLTPQDLPQARTLLENQRSALRSGLLRNLEMAYGLGRIEKEVINEAVMLEMSEQFQSLYPGFTPRPPAESSLRGALEDLLKQALAHQYPGHPDFQVDGKITKGQIRSVWEELAKLPEAGGERLEVNKILRPRVRAVAQPLHLGQMAETHFVPSNHWPDHFDRKIHLEGLKEPTVADLDRWMDEPKPMGLPEEFRDLVVLFFASRTNRSFKIRGVGFQPEIGNLKREATLVVQPLPTQEQWERAREIARKVFEVESTPLLNADTVSRFADSVRERAQRNQEAVSSLPGVLAGVMKELELDPEASDRLQEAREARDLLRTIAGSGTPKDLVESMAALEYQSTTQELAAGVRSAPSNVGALRTTRTDVFKLLRGAEGQKILADLHRTLQSHEFAVPLERQLKEGVDKAWRLVNEQDTVVPPKPTGHSPTPLVVPPASTAVAAERKVLEETALENLTVEQALEKVEALKAKLTRGRRLDISWRLWEE